MVVTLDDTLSNTAATFGASGLSPRLNVSYELMRGLSVR